MKSKTSLMWTIGLTAILIFSQTKLYAAAYDLIPVFMDAGVTGMYPFETQCGMDIEVVRKKYPSLQMPGGIPKSEISKGPDRIEEILKPVEKVLQSGGYITFGDHFIPPDVDFENFSYYRNRLNDIIDKYGK